MNVIGIRELVEKNYFMGQPLHLSPLLGTPFLGVKWCVRKSENTVRIAIIPLVCP